MNEKEPVDMLRRLVIHRHRSKGYLTEEQMKNLITHRRDEQEKMKTDKRNAIA